MRKRIALFVVVAALSVAFEITMHEVSHVVAGIVVEDLSLKSFTVFPPRVTLEGGVSQNECPRQIAPLVLASLWFVLALAVMVVLKRKQSPYWYFSLPLYAIASYDILMWIRGYIFEIQGTDGYKFFLC